MADASGAVVREILGNADWLPARFTSNHALLGELLDTYLAPEAWLAAFDQTGRTFVAGSLLYSENLTELIVFLALARGGSRPDGIRGAWPGGHSERRLGRR